MALTLATPGVYIEEKSAFPNSVAAVPTAVPAFVGYTEKAESGGKSLVNKPVRITSMAEYTAIFGAGTRTKYTLAAPTAGEDGNKPEADLTLSVAQAKSEYVISTAKATNFTLYNAIRLFYANGGGPCYIVSVGTYGGASQAPAADTGVKVDEKGKGDDKNKPAAAAGNAQIESTALTNGLNELIKVTEPTMVVIPEAMNLDANACYSLQKEMLMHCGYKMQSRVALLDVYDGYLPITPTRNVINEFREGVGSNQLDFAAAYYPWVETTVVPDNEIDYRNLDAASITTLQALLKSQASALFPPVPVKATDKPADEKAADKGKAADKPAEGANANNNPKYTEMSSLIDSMSTNTGEADPNGDIKRLNQVLMAQLPAYKMVLSGISKKMNLMPPAAAMAGLYTMTDNTRGVWKAPANMSMNAVIAPSVNLSHDDQQDLNVTLTGKSINAIRSFTGEGTIVWGARTLDGNSQDWRYISVRRTMIYMEQSIKAAAKAYVFEPNDAKTWMSINTMISNFLSDVWKQGGLAGSTPAEAFSVSVGLGSTMTAVDILDGIMRISVKVAVTRPAEFIVITFEQQMQQS